MAILNSNFIDEANTTFQTVFDDVYNPNAVGSYQVFTQVVPTDAEIIKIDVPGAFGGTWREWVGPKVFLTTRLYQQTARLKRWEKSFYLDRMTVAYDRSGHTGRMISNFVRSENFYDIVTTNVLVSNPTGYDNVALFSASHPHGRAGATQSNTTTSALSPATYEAARLAGQTYANETGEPLGVVYDTLMVGPKLERVALEIAGEFRRTWVDNVGTFGEQGTAGTSVVGGFVAPNVYEGKIRVVVNPRLIGTYDDYWFLLATNMGAKPIIVYEGRAPTQYALTNMEEDLRFHQDKMAWSLEADAVAVAGAWQTVYAGIL